MLPDNGKAWPGTRHALVLLINLDDGRVGQISSSEAVWFWSMVMMKCGDP